MFGTARKGGRARKRLSFDTVKRINALLKQGLVQEARDEYSGSDETDEAPAPVEVSLRDEAIRRLKLADAEGAAQAWNDWRETMAIRNEEGVYYPDIDLSGLNFGEYPFPIQVHSIRNRPFPAKTIDGYNLENVDLDRSSFPAIAFAGVKMDGNYGLTYCRFERTLFVNCHLNYVWFDDSTFEGVFWQDCSLKGCDAYRMTMDDCTIDHCTFDDFDCPHSQIRMSAFYNTLLLGFDAFDSHLSTTRFSGGCLAATENGSLSQINFCKLTNVAFANGCELNEVNFHYGLFNKVNFSGAIFKKSAFTGVMYRRRLLQNCFRGVTGLHTITGNAYFKADALDQKFFDDAANDDRDFQFEQAVKHAQRDKSTRGRKTPWFQIKGLDLDELSYTLERQFNRFGLFCGAVIGALVLCSVFDFNLLDITHHPVTSGLIVGVSIVLVSLTMGAPGRRLSHGMWQLLDYGRDWDRILGLAFAIIAVMGTIYAFATPADICYVASPIAPAHGLCVAPDAGAPAQHSLNIYPWFVALMGFTTLGMADFVQARSTVGAIIMAVNAFAGYAILGLFLAVLQASFMRRRPGGEPMVADDDEEDAD